jgi:hypothetical protein
MGSREEMPVRGVLPSCFVAVRDDVLALGSAMGELATIVKESFPLDTVRRAVDKKEGASDGEMRSLSPLQGKLSEIWLVLVTTASHLSLHLPECAYKKIEVNRKKYPVAMCKVRSNVTGAAVAVGRSMETQTTAYSILCGTRAPRGSTPTIRMKQELRKKPGSRCWTLLSQIG